MKRILVVLGGDRPKGNTRQLADAFIQGAVDAGHEVELISLNQVEVKGCMGCIMPVGMENQRHSLSDSIASQRKTLIRH